MRSLIHRSVAIVQHDTNDYRFLFRQVLAHVRTIPELILLGNSSHNVKRLPIFSFMVRHPRGTFLHHNFVCAVLNDVFGIQARGGCACTGRYAHHLMGIDRELAKKYESILLERYIILLLHLNHRAGTISIKFIFIAKYIINIFDIARND